MEILVAIIVLVVLSGTALALVATRRPDRGLPLETPPDIQGVPPQRAAAPEGPPEVLDLDDADLNEPSSGVGLAPRPGEAPPPEEVVAEPVPEPDAETVAEIEDALAEAVEQEQLEVVRPSFRDRLGRARGLIAGYVGSVLSRTAIDDQTWEELEEALIRADVGVGLTGRLLDDLRKEVADKGITEPAALLDQLKADLKASMAGVDRSLHVEAEATNVWLFVGVNGVGKTTTIGKVARRRTADGHQVLLAAGDTFRAAAAEQLALWAERTGTDLVRGSEGGDPASVIFDAVQSAHSRGVELVLADTAGRLHTKVNLMEELRKVRRVAERPPGRVSEVLLVIDATTGQNGLAQAQQFTDAVEVTGVVLTKLDGSAKGGIVLAVQEELGIPVKMVGLGETADDLVDFDPDEFVEALFA